MSMLHSDVLIVKFEHISRFFSGDSIVDFEQVNVAGRGQRIGTFLPTLDPIN